MTCEMVAEITIHRPSVKVKIDRCFDGGVVVLFGDWPSVHTTWFLDDEVTLNDLINNLLRAEFDYIARMKGGKINEKETITHQPGDGVRETTG